MRAAAFALWALTACAHAPVAAPVAERDPPVFVEAFTAALNATGEDRGGAGAQMYATLGREDLIVERTRPTCASLLQDGVAVDPVAEIARLSEGYRVVIINEAHDHPQHRAFIAEVASALRREGFSLYAAETFTPSIREPRAWLSMRDGYYTNEPAFAALVAQVRGDGYRLFDYEYLEN